MIRSALMNVMTAAALKAGRGLKRDFGEVENLQVSVKGPGDFVSAADRKAEKILHEELARARPGYGFVLEESGRIDGPDKSHYLVHRSARRNHQFPAWLACLRDLDRSCARRPNRRGARP